MPRITVHQASDGTLHRTYDEYAKHEEALRINHAYVESELPAFIDDVDVKSFILANKNEIEKIILKSKVKRKAQPKKK
ncbi:TPA: hypothetical protein ACSE8G_003391 [Acinetobacter baumannii]